MRQAFALGHATAARPVEADRMNLVEVGHGAVFVGEIANLGDRRDVAVHRVDRFECDEFRHIGIGFLEQLLKVFDIVVAEDFLFRAAGAYAGNHRSVVQRVRENHAAR